MKSIKLVGSTPVGKMVAQKAGKQMMKCTFELGGSDPFIVLDDADIELAVAKAYDGRFKCNAQACNNSKRFIVHEAVYD